MKRRALLRWVLGTQAAVPTMAAAAPPPPARGRTKPRAKDEANGSRSARPDTGGGQAPSPAARAVLAWVDPFIGTDGMGHVAPGAALPFGMVLPSPDTQGRGARLGSGYHSGDARVLGFSNTHISGASAPELGDVLLQPINGQRWSEQTSDFSARLDKASERARPGYYSVGLPEHGVRVELSAQQRVAVQRYTFARQQRSQLLVDLQHGLAQDAEPRVLASQVTVDAARGEISGTVHVRGTLERQCSFVLKLDRPIERVRQLAPRAGDKAPRYLLEFELGATRMVVARVALSTVDVEGARRNLAQAGRPTFQEVREAAERAWAELLGRVQVDSEDERTRRIFYSALYRCFIHPSDIADADGRVRGPRGVVLSARGGSYYSALALWSSFRATHPLLTLLVPERVDGMVQSLLEHQRQQGYLPLETAWGRESWRGVGNPALPVIADALLKGFSGFDAHEALEAMITTSSAPRPDAPGWAQRDWGLLDQHGYVPFDLETRDAALQTVAHGVGDDAVARVAQRLARGDIQRAFAARKQGWRLLWDPGTRMVRGKDSAGRWQPPVDTVLGGSVSGQSGRIGEANAWLRTAVPALHDPEGFRDALGGAAALREWLDALTSTPGAPGAPGAPTSGVAAPIGQLEHGHVLSHHIAWLHAFGDQPWKAATLVQRLATSCYSDARNGLAGPDGGAQLSAWYVFAALGLYPMVPGGGRYVAGAPLVRRAWVRLAAGATLRIESDGSAGQAPRAVALALDGQPLVATAVLHEKLVRGGTLRFSAAA